MAIVWFWRPGQRISLALLICAVSVVGCSRTEPHPPPPPGVVPIGEGRRPGPEGLSVTDDRAYRGYTLMAPLISHSTYLTDIDGHVVHSWKSDCTPALSACLLEDGHLLRTGALPKEEQPYQLSGGGGRVQEFTWEGELIWDFRYVDERRCPHHDAMKLPNGNVLMLVCDRMTADEAVATGRKPSTVADGHLLTDGVVEIKPTGKTTGEVVWEWRVWDHLVQDFDKAKPHHGQVSAHSELIDLNYHVSDGNPLPVQGPDLDKLRSLGYVGGSPGSTNGATNTGDWTHLNTVTYNSELDQIALTSLGFREIWIIDHSTTKAEAAGHTGGKSGKGGDLLYRWGNPAAYRLGTNHQLNGPHNAHWIPKGLPGAGHMLVFNNLAGLPNSYSSVLEIVLPVNKDGQYDRPREKPDHPPGKRERPPGKAERQPEKSERPPEKPFGPDQPVWSYSGDKSSTFFSPTFSSAQRLPNGNTFICLGLSGTLIEVTPDREVVWKFAITDGVKHPPGMPPPPHFGPGPGISLFRSDRYAPDYPGLAGRELKPEPRD